MYQRDLNYYNYGVFSQSKSHLVLNLLFNYFILWIFVFTVGCVKKNTDAPVVVPNVSNELKPIPAPVTEVEKKDLDDLKKWAEKIRFLASIEKESLKVLNSNIAFTQIEVISFAFDRFVGIKKPNIGLFCHQFNIKQVSKQVFEIFAICEKPVKKLAEIKLATYSNSEMTFFTRQWAPIVGEFPALTAPDRICSFSVKENAIASISCKNTIYALPPEFVEELRLEQFEYQKSKDNQVSIDGGIFRDLVKRREIKMNVPMAGAIEIVERELKVRDDFEHLLKKNGR